jgi:polygalacturonase
MGYQNQSTAWILGGDNIKFTGNGYGTFDGNGQIWYDFVRGASNYPRRPHALTISNTTNSVFQGLRFVQSQMWTMTVIHSKNVLLEDIYVSSTSNSQWGTSNTDGADTIYADNITFNRWEVINGDDAISPKANSTNILVTNSIFHQGSGIALGSIGQYDGVFERIENFTAINVTSSGTLHAVYFKTWTGQRAGYPPNGGGGGLGCKISYLKVSRPADTDTR